MPLPREHHYATALHADACCSCKTIYTGCLQIGEKSETNTKGWPCSAHVRHVPPSSSLVAGWGLPERSAARGSVPMGQLPLCWTPASRHLHVVKERLTTPGGATKGSREAHTTQRRLLVVPASSYTSLQHQSPPRSNPHRMIREPARRCQPKVRLAAILVSLLLALGQPAITQQRMC